MAQNNFWKKLKQKNENLNLKNLNINNLNIYNKTKDKAKNYKK